MAVLAQRFAARSASARPAGGSFGKRDQWTAGEGFTAAAAFAALAAVAAQAEGGGLLTYADHVVFTAVRARRRPESIAAARVVSALAEPGLVYPAVAAVGLGLAGRASWRRAAGSCLVVASGAVTRRVLCQAIARPRPPAAAWLTKPSGFSLPSRHTALAALAAGVCLRAFGAGARRDGACRCWQRPGWARAAYASVCTGPAMSSLAGCSPRAGSA